MKKRYRPSQGKTNRGFTLVEVMVALALVAIALPALLINAMQQLDGTAYVRDKSIAQWVALNKMTELRLINRHSGKIPKTKQSGRENMAGRDWYWSVRSKRFEQEELPDMYGIEVTVRNEDDDKLSPMVTLVGILHQWK